MSTEDTNAACRGSESNDLLGLGSGTLDVMPNACHTAVSSTEDAMRHTITLTVEIESDCESTIAIEHAVCSCLAAQDHGFQQDDGPEVDFFIVSAESENAGVDTDLARMAPVVQDFVRRRGL